MPQILGIHYCIPYTLFTYTPNILVPSTVSNTLSTCTPNMHLSTPSTSPEPVKSKQWYFLIPPKQVYCTLLRFSSYTAWIVWIVAGPLKRLFKVCQIVTHPKSCCVFVVAFLFLFLLRSECFDHASSTWPLPTTRKIRRKRSVTGLTHNVDFANRALIEMLEMIDRYGVHTCFEKIGS